MRRVVIQSIRNRIAAHFFLSRATEGEESEKDGPLIATSQSVHFSPFVNRHNGL